MPKLIRKTACTLINAVEEKIKFLLAFARGSIRVPG